MTIGQTSVSIAKIIDSSVRRIGLPVETQTPETIELAKTNLYLIMMNLANRGINFWAIDEQFLVLTEGKAKYDTAVGTVDILNNNYRTITEIAFTDSSNVTQYTSQFASATDVVMIYVDSPTTSITVEKSTDGVTYSAVTTLSRLAGKSWHTLDGVVNINYLRLSNATALTITDVKYISQYRDVPMYRLNRDDYLSLPNKMSEGTPLQFWYDRQVSPVVNLWPVPNSASSANCIQYFRKRQIADIGKLTEELELPPRWLDAIVWLLAQNMAFEMPQVPLERINLCATMAQKALAEVELEERDNSPINIQPNISVYTS